MLLVSQMSVALAFSEANVAVAVTPPSRNEELSYNETAPAELTNSRS